LEFKEEVKEEVILVKNEEEEKEIEKDMNENSKKI